MKNIIKKSITVITVFAIMLTLAMPVTAEAAAKKAPKLSMFTAKKYNAIHLLPEPNISPRYWEDIIWMPSEDHTGMVKIFEKENYLTINVSFDRKNHTFTKINSDDE